MSMAMASLPFVSVPASSTHDGDFRPLTVPRSSSFPAFHTRSITSHIPGFALNKSKMVRRNGLISIKCEAYSNVVSTPSGTEWFQKIIELQPYKRGCHIITQKIYSAAPEIKSFEVGLANLFVMHTSASLTINENASPDVPLDMEDSLNRIVPEGRHYRHLDEGSDDMPAHVKSSMMGCSLTIPIKGGRFSLGIWQGIWLNEHRNYGGPRRICMTIQGVKRSDGRMYT